MLRTAPWVALLFCVSLSASAQTPHARDFATRSPETGPPRSFRLLHGIRVEPANFFARYRSILGLASDVDEVFVKDITAFGAGATFTRYQQQYRGYPVIGAEFTLVHRDNLVFGGTGRIINTLASNSNVAARQFTFSEASAVGVLLDEIARKSGVARRSLTYSSSRVTRVVAPQGYDYAASNYRTAYRIVLNMTNPASIYYGDVNATTGALLRSFTTAKKQFVDMEMTGESVYYGPVDFPAQADSANVLSPRLVSTTPYHLEAVDMMNVPGPNPPTVLSGVRVVDGDNDGIFEDPEDAAGVSAHWAAGRTFAYLQNEHLFTGIGSAAGNRWVNYVRFSNIPNAYFYALPDGAFAGVFGDGTAPTSSPVVDLDAVAHEIGHGVQYILTPDPDFFGERGALGESFSDILAVATSFQSPETTPDWLVFEQSMMLSSRNFIQPKFNLGGPGPNAYLGDHWGPTANPTDLNDFGFVHQNANVQNFWFRLLSEGGTGTVDDKAIEVYNITGVGLEKATRIAFYSLAMLNASGNYVDAVNQSLLGAIDIYGLGSQAHAATHDAWYAVDLIPTPYDDAYFTKPAKNEHEVLPWDTEFRWQRLNGEETWEMQVSVDPTFQLEVHSGGFDELLVDPVGGQVARKTFQLKPNTTYHWRVRANLAGQSALGDWRPVRKFTTGDVIPKILSPTADQSRVEPFHPWRLRLEWEVEGEHAPLEFDYEVYLDSALTQLIVKGTDSGVSQWIDVGVDRDHYWRIRARPQGSTDSTNVGAWEYETFVTSMPQVQLIEPANNAAVYPWNQVLRWENVAGAEYYILEIAHDKNGFSPGGTLDSIELEPNLGQAQHYGINLIPESSEDFVLHEWRVRVVGPPVQILGKEEGTPSNIWTMVNDGSKTTPEVEDITLCAALDPSITECPIRHITAGDSLELSWKHRPEAQSYLISIYQFHADDDTWYIDFSAPLHSIMVERDNADHVYQREVIPGVFITPYPTSVHGLYYVVQAVGPDGSLSPVKHQSFNEHLVESGYSARGEFLFYLDPAPIEPVLPGPFAASGNVMLVLDGSDSWVEIAIEQDPWWTPTSSYEIEIFDEPGCPGVGAKEISNFQGQVYLSIGKNDGASFRVRGYGFYPSFYIEQPNLGWSDCRSFHTATNNELAEIYCGDGELQDFEQCDDGNTVSGDGCTSACHDEALTYVCDTEIIPGGEAGIWNHPVELGANSGGFWVAWDTATIPDQLIVKYENQVIYETTCMGTQSPTCSGEGCGGATWIDLPTPNNGDTQIYVTVVPHCASGFLGDTIWAFYVQCPGTPEGDIPGVADDEP